MKCPYCPISNKLQVEEILEYGNLSDVLDEYDEKLENNRDWETALIKGVFGGLEVSLLKYRSMLVQRSAPHNLKELLEHNQNKEPIGADEKMTDHDWEQLLIGGRF